MLLSLRVQHIYVLFFVYQAKGFQPHIGSSELHHLSTSTDYSLTVKPHINAMQTKLLKLVFPRLVKRQPKELDDLWVWSAITLSYLIALPFIALHGWLHELPAVPTTKQVLPPPSYVFLGLPCLLSNTGELGGKKLLEANEKHCFKRREALGKRMKKEKEQRAVLLKKSRNLESCCPEVRIDSAPTFALPCCVQGTPPTPLLAQCSELSFCQHRGAAGQQARPPNLLIGSFQQANLSAV